MTDKNRPVYMIGIAAELVGIHPQTLRLYEREELVIPQRTAKETRLYSENDIALLNEIQEMTQSLGLNLAGVKLILKMKHDFTKQEDNFESMIEQAQKEINLAHSKLNEMKNEMEDKVEIIKKSFQYSVVPYRSSALVVRRSEKDNNNI